MALSAAQTVIFKGSASLTINGSNVDQLDLIHIINKFTNQLDLVVFHQPMVKAILWVILREGEAKQTFDSLQIKGKTCHSLSLVRPVPMIPENDEDPPAAQESTLLVQKHYEGTHHDLTYMIAIDLDIRLQKRRSSVTLPDIWRCLPPTTVNVLDIPIYEVANEGQFNDLVRERPLLYFTDVNSEVYIKMSWDPENMIEPIYLLKSIKSVFKKIRGYRYQMEIIQMLFRIGLLNLKFSNEDRLQSSSMVSYVDVLLAIEPYLSYTGYPNHFSFSKGYTGKLNDINYNIIIKFDCTLCNNGCGRSGAYMIRQLEKDPNVTFSLDEIDGVD
ncbi:hypothetical protein [La Joya virus]|uniref:Uncharacterized protein n=1 Tax=La Joya virus TaxID=1272946 RepID=A0A0D3R0X5_9RHAB|nr:hypothetical protein [La Joya virus]AJR28299.1 hypothetical protein [La Joya virus]